MVKLNYRQVQEKGGTVVSAVDSTGTTFDVQAGDIIAVCRKRGAGAFTAVTNKQGALVQFTIPAGIAALVDAIGIEASIRALIRVIDDGSLNDTQKAAIYNQQTLGTIQQTTENPWA